MSTVTLDHISHDFTPIGWSSGSLAAVWPRPLPSANDWCDDAARASVSTMSALFRHIVASRSKSLSTLGDRSCQLSVAASVLLENCPVSLLSLLISHLKKEIPLPQSVSSESSTSLFSDVIHSCMTETVLKPFERMIEHPNLSRLEQLAQRAVADLGTGFFSLYIYQRPRSLMAS